MVKEAWLNSDLISKKIHFIGIGGIGMSALARFLYNTNINISGSDKEDSPLINDLRLEGIKNIWTPHNKNKIGDISPDLIIYSTAIESNNEELEWAKKNNKTVLHRSALLELLTNKKQLISISGTHGKTTTTGITLEVLLKGDLNPSAIVGGILDAKNTNAIAGNGDYFIIEADESDKSFLKGEPEISVITNIEPDHLENYPGGLTEIKSLFHKFAKKGLTKTGLIACFQDKVTAELIKENFDLNNPKLITYGINTDSSEIKLKANFNARTSMWDVSYKKDSLFSFKLKTPGNHNILNALAATAVGHLLGVSTEKIKPALENYSGIKRRFQILQKTDKITIVDDYAHHPTEVSATIQAAKELNPKRLVIIFQPHQPRRLQDLWKDFVNVFKNEDFPVFITDLYIARGNEIKGISSPDLVQEIGKQNVKHITGSIKEIARQMSDFIKEGDFILIMGAGNITNLGPELIKLTTDTCMKFREQLI